ncbi:hypothetical protein D3C72_485800 [compost metagenome]
MSVDNAYKGREQTLVKHQILKLYIERFSLIVGSQWKTLTYVDCFSGPWKEATEDYRDTSFAIAIEQLKKARQYHLERGREIGIRCMFLERSKTSYARLAAYAQQAMDENPFLEIRTLNQPLEDSIDEILSFVREAPGTFPFFFIDPTGWSGFGLKEIAPLLRLTPGEVLINFMTSFVKRFIDHPDKVTRQSFEDLFGNIPFNEGLATLPVQDREDALVNAYAENVKRTGHYKEVCTATVLHPTMAKTHFHLIYGTRHIRGIQKFKEVEKKAMSEMEAARAEAQQRKRESCGQLELFGSQEMHNAAHYDTLRERYLNTSKQRLRERLMRDRRVSYDIAYVDTLKEPLIWESDLKEWVQEWRTAGCLDVLGLAEGKRVPSVEQGHTLVWKS